MSAPKAPLDNNGSIIIRFTHSGCRFTLSKLGAYSNSVAWKHAQTICDRIALDIASGNFTAASNEELVAKYHPQSLPLPSAANLEDLIRERLEKKYSSVDQALLRLLGRYKKPITTEQEARKFITWLSEGRSPSTVLRYLNLLKGISPLFRGIRVKMSAAQLLPKPFNRHEVSQIQTWFSENYPHYSDFVSCLFLTGMRTSEAIGLRWQDVDLDSKLLIISESLTSPTRDSRRIRKDTKAGAIRYFPLSGKLLEILEARHEIAHEPSDLIFTSPTGKPIDDHTLSQRQWKRCLQATGIPHRPLYNTRHTFISHYLAETKDFVSCATLTHGTRTGIQTLMKHYAGLIHRVEVPDLY